MDPADHTIVLTKRGARMLDGYIERLIDVAAAGKADFAFKHRWDIERIFERHSRKTR